MHKSYADIERLLNATPFGEVSFVVKRHENQTVGLVVNNARSEKYEDNVKALAAIVTRLKQALENKDSGTTSLSVVMDKGRVSRIIWQGYEQENYPVEKA